MAKTAAKIEKAEKFAKIVEQANAGLVKLDSVPEVTEFNPIEKIDLDSAMDALSSGLSLKDSELKKGEADFWKPVNPGDGLSGVYLGTDERSRLKQHVVGVKSQLTGNMLFVRFNGSMQLTKDIENNGEKYRFFKLTWNGKVKTGSGNERNDFTIVWGPRIGKD